MAVGTQGICCQGSVTFSVEWKADNKGKKVQNARGTDGEKQSARESEWT